MTPEDLAPYLDFANHHQNSTHGDIQDLCQKVLKYGFNSAFVNPYYVRFAKEVISDPTSSRLRGASRAKVGTVVSFPLGQEAMEIKAAAASNAVENGADEIDVCLNVGLIKEGKWVESLAEMKAVVEAVRFVKPATVVKFIPEVSLLTDEEIKKMAGLILESGADFFKTSTGSVGGSRGPSVSDIKLVREVVGEKLKIKVVGGVTTYEQAIQFIEAGADRIGTSHAVEIVEGNQGDKGDKGE